jgi:GST-like protein
MNPMTLYGRPGWGSVLTEAQLVWYAIPFTFHEVGDLFTDEPARRELARINPLAQIPTLVLPDGAVMTESAAITLWLADQTGSHDLVPEPQAAERARFLRWLIFITSNIYPTYTYADDPSRFVAMEAAQEGFAERVNAYAKTLYGLLNDQAVGPWFLGQRFSALDLYVAVLSRWRPRRPWFEDNTPKLAAIAKATEALPRLSEVWARNFPPPG